MVPLNCTVGFISIDTTESICAIHNSGDAVKNLQKCCGDVPVQTTPDGCEQYCQYDSKKLDNFTSCLGNGIEGAVCQAAKNTSSPAASHNSTNVHSATVKAYAESVTPRYSWYKSAAALMVFALAAPSLTMETPALGTIRSCSDGQCNSCTTGNHGQGSESSSWSIQYGYPTCEIYSSVTFKGAESKLGGGYDVWWDIGKPDPGCQIIVMSPVGQDVAGSNCGNIVLAAKDAGCLYAHLEDTFMVQYCCGSGDCSKAGVGGSKRDISDFPTLMARAQSGELGADAFAATVAMNGTEPIASFSLNEKRSKQAAHSLDASPGKSLTARAARYADAALGKRDDSTCSNAQPRGDSYTKAAAQIQLTDVLTCGSTSPCNQQVGKQISVAHTLISEHSNTFTRSGGVAVKFEAGIDFLVVQAKTSVEGHAEMASAIMDASGTQDTTAKINTINQVYSQVPGTSGYIWFTPSLNCQKVTMTCGQQGVDVEKCDPALLKDGGQKGEMGFTSVAH